MLEGRNFVEEAVGWVVAMEGSERQQVVWGAPL